MKTAFFTVLVSFFLAFPGYSQEIVTAERFMESVSQVYNGVHDYEARVNIRSGNTEMTGNLSYLSPSFLRIDFTRPQEQAIVFNGELLTVYLPEYRAILNQTVNRSSPSVGASLASAQGLSLLRRNYVPSFVSSPSPVPLEPNSTEMVVQLRLARRVISEGFREIILSVNPNTLLIRRIEGRTIADGNVRFDFLDVRTNVGIPELRFVYTPPSSANSINNFLFRDSD